MQLQKLQTWPKSFDDGFYGTVIFDRVKRTAIKIFKKSHSHDRSHIESTYRNEIAAYALANAHPDIQGHVPAFFGKQDIDSILDHNGNDISDQYYLDLNFKMEFIEGCFEKFGNLPSEHSNTYAHLFKMAGINHYCDCNFIIDENGVYKFIDISTKEIIPEW